MIENLQIKIKTLASEASHIRKVERKQLGIMDFESQTQSFRHQKDEPRPEPRKWPVPRENSQEVYDEATAKYWNLHHHRVNILRKEARINHLAYGFLRGVPYKEMEITTHDRLDTFEDQAQDYPERRIFAKIRAVAKRHNTMDARDFNQRWAEWIDNARDYLKKAN